MKIRHKGLRALHERDDRARLPAQLVPRLWRILFGLQEATHPWSADAPGFRLHPLKGDRAGQWSVRVSGNWRVVFRFEDGEAVDVDLVDCHRREGGQIMNGTGGEHVGAMLNPPHLGELIRESMDEVGWNVTETAAHLGCERGTLSRLLNGKAGVSANMALALEALGWGTADHWMRMQASYELAQARRERGWREDIRARDAVPR